MEIFGRQFVITGTEKFVYNYLLENSDKFSTGLVKNIREHLEKEALLKDTQCLTKNFEKTENRKENEEDVICGTDGQLGLEQSPSDDKMRDLENESICRSRMLSQCNYWDAWKKLLKTKFIKLVKVAYTVWYCGQIENNKKIFIIIKNIFTLFWQWIKL